MALSQTVPVLPLKETVVFPDSMVPLAVGQERSLKLIADVVADSRMVALVTVRDGEADVPMWADIYHVGTLAVVEKVIGTPDGTVRILVKGLCRVRLDREVATEPYLIASFVTDPDHEPEANDVLVRETQELFAQVVDSVPYLPEELRVASDTTTSPGALCHLVVTSLRLTTDEKQNVLEIADVEERLRRVADILRRELETGQCEFFRRRRRHLTTGRSSRKGARRLDQGS